MCVLSDLGNNTEDISKDQNLNPTDAAVASVVIFYPIPVVRHVILSLLILLCDVLPQNYK